MKVRGLGCAGFLAFKGTDRLQRNNGVASLVLKSEEFGILELSNHSFVPINLLVHTAECIGSVRLDHDGNFTCADDG